jgi:choline monooxygenase
VVFHHRASYALEANWKVAVENFLECYHCAVAHPGFSDVIDVDHDAYRLEPHPTFASHYARVRDRPRGSHYDASGIDGQFHLVWPSLKVNVMPGRPNISIGPLMPVAPGRTEGVLDYFFAADEDPAWIDDYMVLDDQVGAEDRVLVESVQRGMASGALPHGELMLPSEDLIAGFQSWVRAGLQTPSRGKVSVQERERISSSPS